MATRQTAGKSGKRGTAQAGRTRGGAAASGKPGVTSAAKPARPGQAAGASRPAAAAANAAATGSPASGVLGGAGAAWQAVLRWSGGGLAFSTLVVSLLGLADSAYLTYEHFSQSATFACPENATINCVKVTTSPESHILGIPVAVLGLAFFLFMVAVNTRWGWKAPWAAVHWARLASVVAGIVFVLYLIWAELFRINAICLYCTGVHILTFILFALIVGRAAYSGLTAIPDND